MTSSATPRSAATPAAASAPVPPTAPDPRPAFARALALCGRTLAAVRTEQLDGPTPCPDYSVRQLGGHLVAVLRRFAVIGRGGDLFSVPGIAAEIADDDRPTAERAAAWSAAWDDATREVLEVWSAPGILEEPVRLPFGTAPGRVGVVSYTTEFTLHTWDLATATGQRPAWEPSVLAVSLDTMQRAVPAEQRGGRVPFGPVVDVAADAPDIDRLVGWYGRQP